MITEGGGGVKNASNHDYVICERSHIVNIYAHSGNNFINDREHLFNSELLYYLRRNLSRTIIGGDFNCIIGKNDATSVNCHLSKALTSVIRELRLKDAWFIKIGKLNSLM